MLYQHSIEEYVVQLVAQQFLVIVVQQNLLDHYQSYIELQLWLFYIPPNLTGVIIDNHYVIWSGSYLNNMIFLKY